MQEAMKGKKINAQKLLAEVNRNAVLKALKKSKDGLPKRFTWTDQPMEEENLAKMPDLDKVKLWEIYGRIQRFPEEAEKELPKLMELKEKHPNVPTIYNYISLIYGCNQQKEKHLENILETTRKFPDYLFGKTSLAEYHLMNGNLKGVSKALDRKFELYMHYPAGVKVFHVSEVRSFYAVTGIYYAKTNKLARALFCYFILNDVDPEHLATQRLGDAIILLELGKLKKMMSR